MPHKDIEKRRETYRNWYSRNKQKASEYKKITWLAKKYNPVLKNCSYRGCTKLGQRHHPDYSKPSEIVWLCKEHHELEHHHATCKICGDKVLARGFCNKHYKQQRKITDSKFAERTKRVQKEYLKKCRK